MLRRGRIEATVVDGVYRAPGTPVTAASHSWIAALGTRSPLSYLTAASVWQLPVDDDGLVHITRFDRRRLDWPAGVRVHRVLLDPSAVIELHGRRVTTRTETILDCLGWLELGAARTLADRALQQQWLRPADIESRLDRQPGRWGNRRLRLMLATLGDGAHSQAERRLHAVLRQAGIGGWIANYSVRIAARRYVIDVALPEQMIAIEIDGYREHAKRETFQRDRVKQNDLIMAGWTVLRFTWSDLVDHPEYVISRITTLLAA